MFYTFFPQPLGNLIFLRNPSLQQFPRCWVAEHRPITWSLWDWESGDGDWKAMASSNLIQTEEFFQETTLAFPLIKINHANGPKKQHHFRVSGWLKNDKINPPQNMTLFPNKLTMKWSMSWDSFLATARQAWRVPRISALEREWPGDLKMARFPEHENYRDI